MLLSFYAFFKASLLIVSLVGIADAFNCVANNFFRRINRVNLDLRFSSKRNNNGFLRRLSYSMALVDRKPQSNEYLSTKISPITDMGSFDAAVNQSTDGHLVVVKAFVPWCRACKAFDLKYRKLGFDLEKQGAPVKFFEVDVFAVKDVKQRLEIKLAPSVVMFTNGDMVESFSCGPKRFDLVVEKVLEQLSVLSGTTNNFDLPQEVPEEIVEKERRDL